MFQLHPSRVLNERFIQKPYQGVDPNASKFLFIGLDANYSADIERSPIYFDLLQYHEDGSAFWRMHGIHHPFLLPQYKGDGRRYHHTFAKVGFNASHASLVSFIELLHVPTVGRSNLVVSDLNEEHLRYIRKVIFESSAQFIFVSAGVLKLMSLSGVFPELSTAKRMSEALRVLYEDDKRAVFLHLHFSNYGKFERQLQSEAKEIAGLLARSDAQPFAEAL